MKYTFSLIIVLFALISCGPNKIFTYYETDGLKIQKLTNNVFNHISYLETNNYGKVPCNGMILIDNGEAIICDTPVNDRSSRELIDFVEENLKCRIKGIVVTHFHVDCLGGLNEFHKIGVPSYASQKTIELAELNKVAVPQNGFDNYLELAVGSKKIINDFLGEGHTVDNIVCYVPKEKVLFGGCLIKSLGSGKGNLDDANITEWSNSVKSVKEKYGKAKIVIPGHGKCGGTELLDYTIDKFER